ncbi:MAG: hypothetical protein CM1200mP13_03060 [Candidatus Pelagibacterales bacterium]|jgi:hypothetical protein|nr:hypothetical protein [Candidatus Pelagibacter sp.]MDC0988674.1 hypothetical protein [Candidatus Pelagibacter sp.]MDC3099346.1 hypothetical protein [Candidatus Pelagibacter sp.]MDC3142588.1 hypothetical protein [Candidatus Pelagibacter sp.]GIS76947.1 MAG: hypothetical protein CM1200mP13_03060 [Pelagibacterales bacterium]|tara:strand:+ start:989 stop:1213 length:225 start_codon:yes stop_codon:yes gene_type:complete
MTKPFDINRHIIETSLKYDDHTPKERQELENYLKPAIVKKTKPKQLEFDFKAKSEPMNIDISLPPELTKLLEGK